YTESKTDVLATITSGTRISWGANPILDSDQERSHRIVRRGIPYGVRPAPSGGASTAASPAGELGLLFQAFQSDIARQFEFIQRTWVDNPNFPELLLFPGLNTGTTRSSASILEIGRASCRERVWRSVSAGCVARKIL